MGWRWSCHQEQVKARTSTKPGHRLQDAADVVSFLRKIVPSQVQSSYSKTMSEILRKFWHISSNSTSPKTRWEGETILGSRKFHLVASVSSVDPSKLMVRDLSCFFIPCVNNDWKSSKSTCFCINFSCENSLSCENPRYVQPWRLVKVHVKDAVVVRDQMDDFGEGTELEFGGEEECLANILEVGDNFAVLAEPGNEEGVSSMF